ncbi:MAG: hypothetical protein IKY22_01245 [Bacteroidales bacterium]|nr:hypothetical protein [Bacteroidales bacterium]
MRRIIFLLVLVVCFVSCGSEGNISELQEQNKQLEKEKAELVEENKYLKIEIDSLKSSICDLEATLDRIYDIINN